MYWVNIEDRYICIDHIQMFNWQDGALYVYIMGRSVPEMFDDPQGVLHTSLIRFLEKKVIR